MPRSSDLIFLEVGHWGEFFIVDKPYMNMLKPSNGKTASEEKGVLRQTGIELR